MQHLLFEPSSPLHWSWVTLEGPDSRDFLHRLTTANVKVMQPGQGSLGCFLTAQGKIRVYFTLWCLDNDKFAFELDAGTSDHWKSELFTVIDQFTFGEKINLHDLSSSLDSYWIFPASETTSEFTTTNIEEEKVR